MNLSEYSRRPSCEVRIGRVVIGGGHPVAVQSMTNTDTNDTEASVAQIERIDRAGGKIVRLTAQGRREGENLARIVRRLRDEGFDTAVVADIHFLPEVAAIAAQYVDKVRINPGNYRTDRGELEELIARCRERGVALRIGVNHGSLAKRVFDQWGDTPQGMVVSAMEFLRVCKAHGFDQVVVSMKSSNTRVMVAAYRLLVAAMDAEDMHYPIHLGVTEAGSGIEGRIKSAVGIGALLCDGIGDTIRVSLTEAPEREIPVARTLAGYFAGRENHAPIPDVDESLYSPYEYRRRMSAETDGIGGNLPPVIASEIPGVVRSRLFEARVADIDSIPDGRVVLLSTDNLNGVAEQRAFFLKMIEKGKTNPVVIFINQLREKIGVMYGNPETTPGGRALKYFSSVRIDVRRIETLKVGGEMIGNRTRAKIVKNKVAPPFKEAEFDIIYGEGISKVSEIIDLGVKLELIDKAGAWFTVNGERIQGKDKVKEYLESNPEVADKIEADIRANAHKLLTPQARKAAIAAGRAIDISADDFEG